MAQPEWANSATEAVLELLEDADVAISPGAIELNLRLRLTRPPSRATIDRALAPLLDRELVHKPAGRESIYYAITDRGRAYLAGELNDADLED